MPCGILLNMIRMCWWVRVARSVLAFFVVGVLPVAGAGAQGLLLPQGVTAEPDNVPNRSTTGQGVDMRRQGRWVLGATLSSMPAYTGGTERSVGLRPVLAGRVGRWDVSTSSARGLANMEMAGGVSTTVAEAGRWRFGLGARLTHGRRSADDPALAGMPDIRSSVGLRASARYALNDQWRLTASLQQDILRGQGMRGVAGLGWSRSVGQRWVLDVNGGLNLGTARAMRTFYGVPAGAAQAARPAWQPGGGVESWFWGVGLSRALSSHWRVAGSVGGGTLVGDAARSPLTQDRTGYIAQISLAYVGW